MHPLQKPGKLLSAAYLLHLPLRDRFYKDKHDEIDHEAYQHAGDHAHRIGIRRDQAIDQISSRRHDRRCNNWLQEVFAEIHAYARIFPYKVIVHACRNDIAHDCTDDRAIDIDLRKRHQIQAERDLGPRADRERDRGKVLLADPLQDARHGLHKREEYCNGAHRHQEPGGKRHLFLRRRWIEEVQQRIRKDEERRCDRYPLKEREFYPVQDVRPDAVLVPQLERFGDRGHDAHLQRLRNDGREVDKREHASCEGAIHAAYGLRVITEVEQAARYDDRIYKRDDRHDEPRHCNGERDHQYFFQKRLCVFKGKLSFIGRGHARGHAAFFFPECPHDIEKRRDLGNRDAEQRAHRAEFEPARPFQEQIGERKAHAHLNELFDDLRKRRGLHVLQALEITAVCAHDRYKEQGGCKRHQGIFRVGELLERRDLPRERKHQDRGYQPDDEQKGPRRSEHGVRALIVVYRHTLGNEAGDGNGQAHRRNDEQGGIDRKRLLVIAHPLKGDEVRKDDPEKRAYDLYDHARCTEDHRAFDKAFRRARHIKLQSVVVIGMPGKKHTLLPGIFFIIPYPAKMKSPFAAENGGPLYSCARMLPISPLMRMERPASPDGTPVSSRLTQA